MNRWAFRIAGLLMLLIFALLFIQLQRQLAQLQRSNPAATATR